jgi:hypothetical protein
MNEYVTIEVTNLDQLPTGECPTIDWKDLELMAVLLKRTVEQGDLATVLYRAATLICEQMREEAKLSQLPGGYQDVRDDLLELIVKTARQAALFKDGTLTHNTTDRATYTRSPMSEKTYKDLYPLLQVN